MDTLNLPSFGQFELLLTRSGLKQFFSHWVHMKQLSVPKVLPMKNAAQSLSSLLKYLCVRNPARQLEPKNM